MNHTSKGFTLMELLVVIAIIGILAAVVLSSLSTARTKGADAAVKSALGQMRAQSEMYYDTWHNYGVATEDCATVAGNTMFDGETMATIIENVNRNASGVVGGYITCASDGDHWAAHAGLRGGGTWCVDSTGKSAPTTRTGVACD